MLKITNIFMVMALLLSTLVPSGFMPNFDENGFSINICNGGKFVSRRIDNDHADYETLLLIHKAQNPNVYENMDAENECNFSTFSSHYLISYDIPITGIIQTLEKTSNSISFVRLVKLSGMLPPSTGPPYFS